MESKNNNKYKILSGILGVYDQELDPGNSVPEDIIIVWPTKIIIIRSREGTS